MIIYVAGHSARNRHKKWKSVAFSSYKIFKFIDNVFVRFVIKKYLFFIESAKVLKRPVCEHLAVNDRYKK